MSKQKFIIEFVEFLPESADTRGYYAQDYLPYFFDEIFDTETEGWEHIEEYCEGPDCNGVTAIFNVAKAQV